MSFGSYVTRTRDYVLRNSFTCFFFPMLHHFSNLSTDTVSPFRIRGCGGHTPRRGEGRRTDFWIPGEFIRFMWGSEVGFGWWSGLSRRVCGDGLRDGGFGSWFLFRGRRRFFPETDETGLFLDNRFRGDVGFGFCWVLEIGFRAEDSTFKGQWGALLGGEFGGDGSLFWCGREFNHRECRFTS